MSRQITMRDLEGVVWRINRLTGSPEATYTKTDGKYTPNVGNYHLDSSYGGWALHRMTGPTGGITDVLQLGHVSKRELYNAMFAFIAGLDAARERAK